MQWQQRIFYKPLLIAMENVANFVIAFVIAAGVTVAVTSRIRRFAIRKKIVDEPTLPRKIHSVPIPLLGGWALFAGIGATFLYLFFAGLLNDSRVPLTLIQAVFVGGGVLMLGGFIDDKYHLPWYAQLVFPILAIIVVRLGGLTMPFVSNPFGRGLLQLDEFGIIATISLADVFLFLWMLGMMYTTKLLDGIDGLATSTTVVAAFMLFAVSLFWDRAGSTTSYLAIALAGAAVGFLFWNWHPAKIFLGESGSTFLGFMVAILAVISGGKIATALLVMGLPILDVAWSMIRRVSRGTSPFAGDGQHLHFRLLQSGFTQQQVVIFYIVVSLLFGGVTFFFNTTLKLIALILLVLVMLGIIIYFERHETTATA